MIERLADADGHVIEPGDLWVQRLPRDLRERAPHFFRDADGVFHQCIYGIDISTLDTIQAGIVPPSDSAALAAAIAGYALDPAHARAHGLAGRLRFEQRFSLERMVDRYHRFYLSLTTSAEGAGRDSNSVSGRHVPP